MTGAFVISRDIFENPIWQNNTEFRLFFLIMGKAVYRDEKITKGGVEIGKGQWLRSYRNLQSDLEYIENNTVKKPGLATIKRTIQKLVDDGRITIKETELGTLFTVVNYCKYQDLNTYKNDSLEQQRNSSGTAAEQQRNNNNKENKEKKEKEVISTKPVKEKYLDYVYLTIEEHNRLINEFGEQDTKRMIELLDNYIGQNPKRNNKYTDHNRVLRGWVKDRLTEEKSKSSGNQYKPKPKPINETASTAAVINGGYIDFYDGGD